MSTAGPPDALVFPRRPGRAPSPAGSHGRARARPRRAYPGPPGARTDQLVQSERGDPLAADRPARPVDRGGPGPRPRPRQRRRRRPDRPGTSGQLSGAELDIEIEGSDASPEAVRYASRQSEARGIPVRFSVLDALREPIPDGFDVVSCSLFLHHLDPPEAVALLRKMAGPSTRLVLVNDLARTRAGYLLAWLGCRVLSRSPVVHYDGPVSVAGAFTPVEARRLADEAGLAGATVTRRWPERFPASAWSRP